MVIEIQEYREETMLLQVEILDYREETMLPQVEIMLLRVVEVMPLQQDAIQQVGYQML